MADGDQRIEVLEDEMKVLKGEVSRTLVDLRALLMREDSPLSTGALLTRVAAGAEQSAAAATQINLLPASEPITTNVTIATGEMESSAMTGLPSIGSINMPEPPGAGSSVPMPSQGDEASVPPAAPSMGDVSMPPSSPSMGDVSVPPSSPSMGDVSMPPSSPSMGDVSEIPNAPSSGDFSPPAASEAPAESPGKPDTDWELERDEERAQQRRTRLKEQEESEESEHAQRARRLGRERAEEEDDRERRDRRRREEDEDDRERRDHRRRDEDADNRKVEDYKSELEDEIDQFRQVRRRGERIEEEMGRLSDSFDSEDEQETGPNHGPDISPIDLDDQDDEFPLAPDSGDPVSDLDDYDEDETGGQDDDVESGASLDRESDRDWDREDESDSENSESYDNGYDADLEDELEYSPYSEQTNNLDSQEYQEEPKINGNNGSRRPRRPDAERRAYEESYYEDGGQEYGRRSQNPPSSPRTSRPPTDVRRAPSDRGPGLGNYGGQPNGGDGQWGYPRTGYDQWSGPQEQAPNQSPMDLNLVSGLVRWASIAKHRVGEKRLSDIIELYVESRGAAPGLKEALTHIASIVDDQPPENGQAAQETLDLIAHLHGILTAALPVSDVPRIHSQISFVSGNRNSNNGDW